MKNTMKYIQDTLGIVVTPKPLSDGLRDRLPLYIFEAYRFYGASLFDRDVVFGELKDGEGMSIMMLEKQLQQIKGLLNQTVVLVLENVHSYQRRRLIERGINFIVPGKQMYLPALLIDMRESFTREPVKRESLLPSAQLLLIYQILGGRLDWKLEGHSFKEIALKFGYSAMAITKAIDNLKRLSLIDVVGEKEKFIRFRYDKSALMEKVLKENLFVNPVLKMVFVDELPAGLKVMNCNNNGLSIYTDINPGSQLYYAVEKEEYYKLQRNNVLVNSNPSEGKYALEVWKYRPFTVNEKPDVVDPLSLFLSMRNRADERIEIALDQLLKDWVW